MERIVAIRFFLVFAAFVVMMVYQSHPIKTRDMHTDNHLENLFGSLTREVVQLQAAVRAQSAQLQAHVGAMANSSGGGAVGATGALYERRRVVMAKMHLTKEDIAAKEKNRQAYFEEVYRSGVWTNDGKKPTASMPKSGTGSTLERTSVVRAGILEVMKKFDLKSMIDAPCGDLTWVPEIFPLVEKYTGIDIVRGEIERHSKAYRDNPSVDFAVVDLAAATTMPKADLIFSRQALQHMSVVDNLKVLELWSTSGARYLLQTSYKGPQANSAQNYWQPDSTGGTNNLPNFEESPYCLGPPLMSFVEQDTMNTKGFEEHAMLWKLPLDFDRPCSIPL